MTHHTGMLINGDAIASAIAGKTPTGTLKRKCLVINISGINQPHLLENDWVRRLQKECNTWVRFLIRKLMAFRKENTRRKAARPAW